MGPVAVLGRGRLCHAGDNEASADDKEAVLGTGLLRHTGAEQPSEILIVLSSLVALSQRTQRGRVPSARHCWR